MAALKTARRIYRGRALTGAFVVAVAVLVGAVWQLGSGEAAARFQASSGIAAVGARPAGGAVAQYQDAAQGSTEGAQAPATHQESAMDNPIIGAWQTHAVSSTAGVQANLLAFLPGGVLIHAASNFPQSAGIGVWYDAGDGTVVYTFTYRRMDKSTGAYIGSTHVHARVTVAPDGMSYDSPLYTELTDVDDNVTSTGTGTSHATRLVATPPDSFGLFASLSGTTTAPAAAVPVRGAPQVQRGASGGLDSSCATRALQEQFC